MSDLKYQTVEQLKQSRIACKASISKLKNSLAGQQTRLEWIEHYLFQKTPQELTWPQIEQKLGHKVIVKELM